MEAYVSTQGKTGGAQFFLAREAGKLVPPGAGAGSGERQLFIETTDIIERPAR